MSALLVNYITSVRIINENTVTNCNQDLRAVRSIANCPNSVCVPGFDWWYGLLIA